MFVDFVEFRFEQGLVLSCRIELKCKVVYGLFSQRGWGGGGTCEVKFTRSEAVTISIF
jgi:hypothetical protein